MISNRTPKHATCDRYFTACCGHYFLSSALLPCARRLVAICVAICFALSLLNFAPCFAGAAVAAGASPAAPGAGGYSSDYGSDYGVGQERRRVLRQPVAVIGLRARTVGGTPQPWVGLRFGDALSRRLEAVMGRAPSAGALARALAASGVRAQDIGSLGPRGARSAPTDRALTILKPALQPIMRVQPAATAAASQSFDAAAGAPDTPRAIEVSNSVGISNSVTNSARLPDTSAAMKAHSVSADFLPPAVCAADLQEANGATQMALQCGPSGRSAMRCGAMRCGAVRCGAMRCRSTRCRSTRCRSTERSALVLVGDVVLGGPVTRPGSSLSVSVSVLRVWDAPLRRGGIGIEAVSPAITLQAPARDWAQLPARTALAVLDTLQIPLAEDERVALLRDASPLMPAATARHLATEQRLGEAIAGAINARAAQVQARRIAPLAVRRLLLSRAIQQGARALKELQRVAASPGAASPGAASPGAASQTAAHGAASGGVTSGGATLLVSGGMTEHAALSELARTAREWLRPTALAVKECRRQLRALPAPS